MNSHQRPAWVMELLFGKDDEGDPLSADAQREILLRVIADHKTNVNALSKAAGVGNSLYNFLNRESHSIKPATIAKLEGALSKLGAPAGPETQPTSKVGLGSIIVRGDLSAGLWREAVEWDGADQYPIDLPIQSRWSHCAFGLRIVGRSMNQKWVEGTIVACVPFMEYGFELESGEDYVVVYRRNSLGLIEATAKRYELHGNEIWLCPESDDDSYKIIKIPRILDDEAPQSHGSDEIHISAVILGGYSPTRAGRR